MSSIYQPAEDSYLLQEILEKQIQNTNIRVLEIGVGSGIQLQTLNKLGIKKENIVGVDINTEAIKHCKKLGFNCKKSNLFSNISGKFDLIIFNPPYLPETREEPEDSRIATTGGKTGSEIINKFLKDSKNHLTKGGKIFLLTSNLTKKINWNNFNKKLLGRKKLFFEELKVYSLKK